MRYNQLYTLVALPVFSSVALAFSVDFFSPGFPHRAGGSSSLSFSGDYPALVNVKLAVQHKDGTLHVVNTSYNVRSTGLSTISFPKDSKPGINYWLIAVDPNKVENYATVGPFTLTDIMDSTSPSASVSADSSEVYRTIGPDRPSPTSTIKPTVGPSGTIIDGNRHNDNPTGDGNGQNDGKSLSSEATIGIAVGGGAAAMILVLIIYHCLFRKTAAPKATLLLTSNSNNNDNASSIQPITKDKYSPSVAPIIPPTVKVNQKPLSPVIPSSPIPPKNYTFNVESDYNYQTENTPYQQQHAYNNNILGQYNTAPYPPHDSMPIPEHASYQYNQQLQQNWNSYSQQQTEFPYSSPTLVEAALTAHNGFKPDSATRANYSQKLEYEHVTSDKIENNHQKPNSNVSPTQSPVNIFTSTQQQSSKPHEIN